MCKPGDIMEFKEQEIFFGYDSHLNINEILKRNHVAKPLLVCDDAFDLLFIKDYFADLKLDIVLFGGFTPNPKYEEIAAGVKLFRESNCDFIISVGGGSSIDVAKCIKLFSSMTDEEIYLEQTFKENELRHLAIPTTAGTGSESTRFAVCYYNGSKQSITHDSLIPDYVVLNPEFLVTLPEYQKKSTLLDALCQAIESLWSINSNEESVEYSVSAITTIL
ncbi:MAG: phosphonoacetaldehyde reductase, partial [Ruminococcaceae bacterium]|nr:phosphonoacetaldehyde reductase [Oscillospiraceae bacterium]